MATYYVATSGGGGSDANPGNIGAPFLTVAHGLGVLNSGDTLYIRGGNYSARIFEVDFAHTGTAWTAGNFITVAGYTGETVTLTNGSGGNIARFQDGSIHHVLLSDMIFDGIAAGGGFGGAVLTMGFTSHHLHFNNLEIKDGDGNGILGTGDSHELRDLNVHGNGRFGVFDGSYKHDNGAYLSYITNSLIIGGRYWDNECIGLRVGSSTTDYADGNTINGVRAYQNGAGIGLGGASPCDSIGCGILLADTNNTVMNCLVYGNTEGIVLYGLSGKTATGLKVYNNTSYDNDGAGISVESSLVSGAEIKNNIIYLNGSTISDVGTGTVTSTNQTTDPSFTNAALFNFTLLVGSSAINAGLTLAVVTVDFANVPRPQGVAYDIGAYEFVSGVTPAISVVWLESGAVATRGFEFYEGLTGTQSYDGSLLAAKFGPGVGEAYKTGVLAPAGRRVSFWFRTDTAPAASAVFCTFLSNTLNTFFSLKLTTSRTITATPQGATAVTGSTVLALNTWYQITIAFTYTNTTTFRFQVYVGSVAEVNCTAGTMSWTGASVNALDFQADTAAGGSVQNWYKNVYIDDGTTYAYPGDVRVSAKRPFANGFTNDFTTQIGIGGSGYGSGHALQVNERPLSTTNGWAMIGAGSAVTEKYNLELIAAGDDNLFSAQFLDFMGWVYAKSLAGETASIIVKGASSNISLTSTATLFYKMAGSTVYPGGFSDIGIVTATDLTTVSLYECGILVAYINAGASFFLMFP